VGWWKQVTEALDQVEILIMVMTPAVLHSAIAHKEWRYARQQGVRVCPVLGVAPGLFDFGQLPSWMRKAHCYDLDREWERFVDFLRSARAENRVPFMAPDLRDDFVPRPAEHRLLKERLLDRGQNNPLAITTALQGAGGFGKTTLASALCHDEDVITAFDDGILWATLGPRPALQQELTKLYAALTGERPTFVDAEDASMELSARLEDRNCLIVIDDVWDSNDAKLFLRGGRQCARLITTRRLQVVTGLEASRVLVDEMGSDEALSLLLARLPFRVAHIEPFRRLTERLGEWPLLLRLASSQLRERAERGDSIEGALSFVNRSLDKKGAVAFDRTNASSRNDAVSATVAASLALLSEADQKRVVELTIFSEPKSVPLSAAAALWGLDAFDTEDLVQRLDDASLLEFDLKTGSLRMHDVLRAHLHTELEDVRTLHQRLVRISWSNHYALPDGFAWRWIGWHLVQSGDIEVLRRLLLEFSWLTAKLRATDVHALQQDFERAGQDEAFLRIRDALRLSTYNVGRYPEQLGTQLSGRLEAGNADAIDQLLLSLSRGRSPGSLRLILPTLTRPGGAVLAIVKGHAASIEALAVSPDASVAVTGSADWTLRLWDLRSWRVIRVFEGHTGAVYGVAFTPDGQRVISASEDRTLRLWDAGGGECMSVLRGHYEAVRGLAVAPDGRTAASISEDGSVRIWDLNQGTSVRVVKSSFHQMRGIAYAPDGSRLIFGAGDGTVRVLDLQTLANERALDGQRAIVSVVAISADGACAVAGGDDGSLRLWDLASGQTVKTFGGHDRSVGCAAFSPGGAWLASGGGDRLVRMWDTSSGEQTHVLRGHAGSVRAIAVLPDGERILTAGGDRMLCCWQREAAKERTVSGGSGGGAVSTLAISSDGAHAVASSSRPTVDIWDASSGRISRSLDGHNQSVQSVQLTGDGQWVLTSSLDRTLGLWRLDNGQREHVLTGHWKPVLQVAMTPTGDKAVSVSLDRTLRLWNARRGIALRVLLGPGSEQAAHYLHARALEFGEDASLQIDTTELNLPRATRSGISSLSRGSRLVISPGGACAVFYYGGTIGIWRLDTGRVLPVQVEDFDVSELAIDADTLVAGSLLGSLCHIDARDGQLLQVLDCTNAESARQRILDIVVDAAKNSAIVASADGTVRVWHLASGESAILADGGGAKLDAAVVAPNGEFIYTVDGDTVIATDLIRCRSAGCVSLDHNITAIAVAPAGRHAALGDEAGDVHFLAVDDGNIHETSPASA